jgi:lysyl-tRNA synthetase class 2
MLEAVRLFFKTRHVLEVDCNALVRYPSLDANIDVIEVELGENKTGYLHTSPEYAMKRLLVDGIGDIYYLGHVFRQGETGPRHSSEFTMVEWYRIGFSFHEMIEETCGLIQLFTGARSIRRLSYQQVFQMYAGFDPFQDVDLSLQAARLGINFPEKSDWDRDTWLQLIVSHVIEPQLGQNELTVLWGYPPSQAALARLTTENGLPVAERFEIYINGLELANGYHELANAIELRCRFNEENTHRQSQGKQPYPIDESFLAALAKGLPDVCGVSVGFDRLMMLQHNVSAIGKVIHSSC